LDYSSSQTLVAGVTGGGESVVIQVKLYFDIKRLVPIWLTAVRTLAHLTSQPFAKNFGKHVPF
jgi:hypothetical protein